MLFAGFPIVDHFTHPDPRIIGFNIGGINGSGQVRAESSTTGYFLNGTGQVPELTKFPKMIDEDTPSSAYTHSGTDGKKYDLVFSDEFNVDGRSFYPGDDPYFEGNYYLFADAYRSTHCRLAVDFHYWPTVTL
jgi:hypothetical protein